MVLDLVFIALLAFMVVAGPLLLVFAVWVKIHERRSSEPVAAYLERRLTRPAARFLMSRTVRWEPDEWSDAATGVTRTSRSMLLTMIPDHLRVAISARLVPWTRPARAAAADVAALAAGRPTSVPLVRLVRRHAGRTSVTRAVAAHSPLGEASAAVYWASRGAAWHRHVDPRFLAAAQAYRDGAAGFGDASDLNLGRGESTVVTDAAHRVLDLLDPSTAEAYKSLSQGWTGDTESCAATAALL